MTNSTQIVEHLFRHQAGKITATLIRLLGFHQLDMIEDVIQEALLQALKTWPYQGVPQKPAAWITQVAKHRALDAIRRQSNWSNKEQQVRLYFDQNIDCHSTVQSGENSHLNDDQLGMMFACCHPSIPKKSQLVLMLKTVSGFSVAEIARAFLAREPTVAQQLVRAKKYIAQHQIKLEVPETLPSLPQQQAVLQAIYLIFNEGYSASQGEQLLRQNFCEEAIRLCASLLNHSSLASSQTYALMALLLFQTARFAARTDQAGDLVLLAHQDRSSWDQAYIQKGVFCLQQSACGNQLSQFHLEAEISACHSLARNYANTDWQRILDCYNLLCKDQQSLVIEVNRAVAVLHINGPQAALKALNKLQDNKAVEHYYPYYVAQAAVAEQLNNYPCQYDYLQQALQLAKNAIVKRFLIRKIELLGNDLDSTA